MADLSSFQKHIFAETIIQRGSLFNIEIKDC